MGRIVTEEQAIIRAQYLDVVYSHSGTLYDLIPHDPQPTTSPSRPETEPPAYGILGSVQMQMVAKYSKKQNQTATPSNQPTPSTKPAPSPVASAEVNTIQSNESSSGNKKGKKIYKT